MFANNRQLSLLYEFLNKRQYLTYDYLCKTFNVTNKTIRSDISIINEVIFRNDLKILLKKNKGFSLAAKDQNVIEEFKRQFQYRFYNIYDLQENYKLRVNTILKKLMLSDEYVKMEDIANSMWLNSKSITKEMKEIRYILNKYSLVLESKPYYGVKVAGDEMNIRFCYMDTICYYNHKVKSMELFLDGQQKIDFDSDIRNDISNLIYHFIEEHHYSICELEIEKLIVMCLIIRKRISQGYTVHFTNEQMLHLENTCEITLADQLIKELQYYFGLQFPSEEVYFIAVFFKVNQDFTDSAVETDESHFFYRQALILYERIMQRLEHEQIIHAGNEMFKVNTVRFLVPIVVRAYFRISENNTTSELVKILKQTPLSAHIALFVFDEIYKQFQTDIGEHAKCIIGIFIYECIRSFPDNHQRLRVAIFSIGNGFIGLSLSKRIMGRFSSYIEKINVIEQKDLKKINASNYDVLMCFDESLPIHFSCDIPIQTTDYYFNHVDYQNFYENFVIPSHYYQSPIQKPKYGDVKLNCELKSIAELFAYLCSLYEDAEMQAWLLNKLEAMQIHFEWLVMNQTLNLIVISNDEKYMKNALITLKKSLKVENRTISRVFFFCIQPSYNRDRIKTAEKLFRNLTCLHDTDDIILQVKPVDYYQYYVYNRLIELKESTEILL